MKIVLIKTGIAELLQDLKMPPRFHFMKELIEMDLKEDPTNFEFGDPEEEIPCDFSCRGVTKLISKNVGEEVTICSFQRNFHCRFKEDL